MVLNKNNTLEWVLRIGLFGTFISHGIMALAVRSSWIPYLVTVGFTIEQARVVMPLIGALDVIIAVSVLLRPNKYIVLYAFFWALATALIRPLSGEPWLEFSERAANWAIPLALYLTKFYAKKAIH